MMLPVGRTRVGVNRYTNLVPFRRFTTGPACSSASPPISAHPLRGVGATVGGRRCGRDRLTAAHESIRGAVVLATCNRFEAYFDLADGPDDASPLPAMDAAMERLAELSALPFRDVRETVEFGARQPRGAAPVLGGIGARSVAVGEDEIAGQVRRALDAARREGVTTAPLEHLFQRATETSRAVKNSTKLGESGRSLVRLAVELAGSRIGSWEEARVLLVGTGRYAAASLAALRDVGAVDIRVHSRSGRDRFAKHEHLTTVSADAFAAEAARADVIVTCTTTTDTFALDLEGHGAARSGVSTPQLIIDLGMPRNVDPGLRSLPDIELLDLDTIRVHAPIDEFATIGEARSSCRPPLSVTRWRAACTRWRPRSFRCAPTCRTCSIARSSGRAHAAREPRPKPLSATSPVRCCTV